MLQNVAEYFCEMQDRELGDIKYRLYDLIQAMIWQNEQNMHISFKYLRQSLNSNPLVNIYLTIYIYIDTCKYEIIADICQK